MHERHPNDSVTGSAPEPASTLDFRAGLWRLADPKISLTSVASMYLGTAVAVRESAFSLTWLVVMFIALFAMEVAKNAWGDVFDFDSGDDLAVAPQDRTPFSGGKRVLVDGLLTRAQTWAIALGFGALGVGLGAAVVFLREPAAFWIGLVGLALGWSYHGPPLRLAYRGLGELDVVACYGPLVALSTYLVLAHRLSWSVFWLSLPLGIIIAAFLWVNEFPDYEADRQSGKHNLVSRLGRRRAAHWLPLIYATAFGVLLCLPLAGLPSAVWLGGLALLPAGYACVRVWQAPETFHRTYPAQPAALIAFLVYSAGAGTGVIVG